MDQLSQLLSTTDTQERQNSIIQEVTKDEILDVLKSMPSNKSLGPDDFTVEFFKVALDIVVDDMIAAIKEFFDSGILLRKVNTTIITVVPKCRQPR